MRNVGYDKVPHFCGILNMEAQHQAGILSQQAKEEVLSLDVG